MDHLVGMKFEVTEFVCRSESLYFGSELPGNANQSLVPVQRSGDGEAVPLVTKPAKVRANSEFEFQNFRYDRGIEQIDGVRYAARKEIPVPCFDLV